MKTNTRTLVLGLSTLLIASVSLADEVAEMEEQFCAEMAAMGRQCRMNDDHAYANFRISWDWLQGQIDQLGITEEQLRAYPDINVKAAESKGGGYIFNASTSLKNKPIETEEGYAIQIPVHGYVFKTESVTRCQQFEELRQLQADPNGELGPFEIHLIDLVESDLMEKEQGLFFKLLKLLKILIEGYAPRAWIAVGNTYIDGISCLLTDVVPEGSSDTVSGGELCSCDEKPYSAYVGAQSDQQTKGDVSDVLPAEKAEEKNNQLTQLRLSKTKTSLQQD